MDRRQRKTREAVFYAFADLLSKKSFAKITVAEIIERADVGRATFYAHFETKDFLLKELCVELFGHIFQTEEGKNDHGVFACNSQDEAFLHLFSHVKNNDNNLVKLLSCENTPLFLEYFKVGVDELVKKHAADFASKKPNDIPDEFWHDHVTATCLETLRWWIERGLKESPEKITSYFLSVV